MSYIDDEEFNDDTEFDDDSDYDGDGDEIGGDEGGDYTEVSEQSWFDRLKESIKSVGTGIVLFLASFVILWWNEGNLVDNYKKWGIVKDKTTHVEASKVDSANDGNLVHLTDKVVVTTPAKDTVFNVTDPKAIKIMRKVEMYQWKETKKTKTKKKVGGKKVKKTTYKYKKDWSSTFYDSSRFKKSRYRNRNPKMQYKSQTFTAAGAKVGAFSLPKGLISQISGAKKMDINVAEFSQKLPYSMKDKVYQGGGDTVKQVYIGYRGTADPSRPQIGDLRISFEIVKPSIVSVIAVQSGSSFKPYKVKGTSKSVFELSQGKKSIDEMAQAGEEASKTFAWLMRLVGFLVMAIGIYLVFNPLVVLADVLPFLGSILSFGISIFAGVIAFALSLLTIAIAWLFYRPILAIILIALGVGAVVGIKFLKKDKQAA